MKILKRILLWLAVICPVLLQAQVPGTITREPESFKKEIADALLAADKRSARDFVEGEWKMAIMPAVFSDEQWEKIFDITDFFTKKRIKTIPHLAEFAGLLVMAVNNPTVKKQFPSILNSLLDVTEKNRSKDFQIYLSNIYNLFRNGTFYSTATIQWKVTNYENVVLQYDKEPEIVFPKTDLICLAKGDSSVIRNTSGVYYPKKGLWVGEHGLVDWKRAGLYENDVYAEAGSYKIMLKSPSFRMDSVKFHHYLFKKPLLGRLDEKILANAGPENARYPRFTSYTRRFEIPNIVDGVDFSGGFTIEGSNFNGFGTSENPARLYFKYKGKTKVEVISDFISIQETSLGAMGAQVVIFLEADSISHPHLNVKFVKSTRLLTMFKTEKGLDKAPFHDTYHNFDIFAESFRWQIDDPVMEIGAIFGSSARNVIIESTNYFSKDKYARIMGLSREHPLASVKAVERKTGSDEFTLMDFARHIQMSTTQAEVMLINLSIDGFIDYDIKNKIAVVNPKTDQYILANKGDIDYDVIEISSNVRGGNNASLDLVNNELTLKGVRFFSLSDSNNVLIFPQQGTIVVKKNRDIKFGGVVYAGKFEFFGPEYYFDYEEFTINMVSVDSARIKVPSFEPQADGSRPLVYLTNVIEGIRGTINVDDPTNKSGLKSKEFSFYPIFDCVTESYVYYDNHRIYDGVYSREDFYYQIPPFKIDSLEKFKTENLYFEGTFYSAGIFEEIEEPLVIMPDYSLGFNLKLPEGGVGIYDDVASFDNEITLWGKGLQGDGNLAFFTSVSAGDEFTFFPDSLSGLTTSFVNTEREAPPPQVPEAHADEVLIQFYPYDLTLLANVYTEPISMFNGQASLRQGYIALSTDKMGGSGAIEFSGAELRSSDFLYSKDMIDADTSAFSLASTSESGMAFRTDNVSAHVDFTTRVGEFVANAEESFVEFPVNQYICFMDKFNWYMDNNDIEMESERGQNVTDEDFVIDTDVNRSSSNFFSIREDQDSLNFLSPKAIFNIDNSIINCKEINFIKVADARIFPDSGKIIIRKRAIIDKLSNAGIVANDITKYHNIYNADIEIFSRLSYRGAGFIDYVDESKEARQIWLKTISVDTIYQTIAQGKIVPEDEFMLSPYFEFQGDVNLEANRQFLVFDGSTRILHDCPEEKRFWFPFRAEVDPDNIQIPVTVPMLANTGQELVSGVVSAADPFGLYPVFLSPRNEKKDLSMVKAGGFVTFNKLIHEYQIASHEKLLQKRQPGNFVALNVNSCGVRTDGRFDLGTKFKPFEFETWGQIEYNPQKGSYNFNASIAIDFFFNPDALKLFLNDINRSPNTKGINFKKAYYEQAIREIMGLESSDKLITDLNLTGAFRKFPEELNKTLFIASIQFYWDDAAEAYKSKGPIGIANIEKKQVFKAIEGKMMITRKRSGDRIEFYFELDERKWYYFNYTRGILEAYSSNKQFNAFIMDTKDDKRVKKGDKETGDFEYIIGSRRKKDNFLDRFEE